MTESTSSKSRLFTFMSALAAIGAGISIWQTSAFFETRSGLAAFKSFCNIGQTFDCTAVEMSNFAEIFPGMPLSVLAIAGYVLILILSLMGLNSSLRKNLKPYLLAFTGVAFLFSVIYLLIMLTQIGKLCILCLGVDSINIILFILALTLPKAQVTSEGTKPSHLLGAGAGAVVIALLFMKGLNPLDGVKEDVLNDQLDSIMATPPVPVEIPADAPVIGDPNAPVTVVKFSDFECPACKLGATSIHPLFKRYPKQVRFVFLNFPLASECNADPNLKRTIHQYACEAAAVAVCATAQGKFEETYETLFGNQSSFEGGKIADLLASKVQGIDLPKLKECMKLPSTADKIRRDSQIGVNLKVQSTPTFFVNGKKVEGGIPTRIWIKVLEKMLNP